VGGESKEIFGFRLVLANLLLVVLDKIASSMAFGVDSVVAAPNIHYRLVCLN
jgi:hypothetical protein